MHCVGKLVGIDLASSLPLPRVVVRFESKKKRFESRSHHQPRDFRGDEACVQRVGSVKRYAKIPPQYRIEKGQKDTLGSVQQRIVVKGDVTCTQTVQITHFFHTGIKRTSCETGIHDRHRTVRAAKWAALGDLDDADLSIDALPQRETVGQWQPKRLQVCTLQYLISTERV